MQLSHYHVKQTNASNVHYKQRVTNRTKPYDVYNNRNTRTAIKSTLPFGGVQMVISLPLQQATAICHLM